MGLNSDTRLGPYEILAPLGSGGMGEVYRARDPRLGREVAIKVLPSGFSTNPDRLRRFEQEARAAGLLNHPNILAIFDIGTHDRAPYIVSELLEGETLRDRFKEGALSTRKAIEFGVQMAHGLATAHEKGIIHRDLKPENIFITKDGRVKVLDFGLAKLTRPEEAGTDLTSLPTTPSGTEAGMVMGTVGYMSPEQVRAKPTDARSDIFSFGVILYEMLSGQRAFHRESNIETMNAILREEPPELTGLGKNIPPGLDRVVTHCLEKSPEQRFQSARDLAFALEALSGVSSSASGSLPAIKAARFGAPVKAVAVAAVVALLALALGYFVGHRDAGRGPTQQPAYRRLTFRRGTVFAARFTPDGKTIAYSATWQSGATELYTVRTEFPESLPIGMSGMNLLAMSPSGELAVTIGGQSLPHGFYRGTLGRAPLSGGTPREILDDVEWADWSPDGQNLAVVHEVDLKRRLEYPIGKVLYETTGWVSHPRISPKGDMIAFLDHPIWPDDRGSVAVVDLSGNKTTLSTGWSSEDGLAWSPSGKEVWFTATSSGTGRWLYAASRSGQVRTVASVAGGMTLQDIFIDGRALLTRDDERVGTMGLGPDDKTERDLSWLDWSYVTDISADGRKIAFSEQGEGGGPTYAACIRATDGTSPVRLGEGNALTISSDGKWILSNIPGTPERLMILPTGSGTSRAVGSGNLEIYRGAGWLPDGKSIVLSAKEPGGNYRTYFQNIDGGSPKPITPEGTSAVLVTHDGMDVLAFDPKGGWWIYPLAGGEKHPVTGIEPGEQPVQWSLDGRSLFIAKFGPPPVNVYKLDLTTHQRVLWKELGAAGRPGLFNIGPIKITPDGKAYAYSYHESLSDLYLAEGLK